MKGSQIMSLNIEQIRKEVTAQSGDWIPKLFFAFATKKTVKIKVWKEKVLDRWD